MSIRLPATFTALRHRDFRLFFAGQFVSLVGSWMQNTAQGWLVVLLATPGALSLAQASGGGVGADAEARAAWYLSLIATANSLPVLLGSLYGGLIADRYSKRRIVIWAQIAQGILALLLGLLVLRGNIQVWHVVGFALLFGVTNVFDIPARQAFVIEMVGKRDLSNAVALNSSLFNGARAFGPAFAGLLLGALSGRGPVEALGLCFLFNAVSFGAVIWGLFRMQTDSPPAPVTDTRPSVLSATRETFAYLNENYPLRLVIIWVAVFSLFSAAYWILLPSLARFTLGADARRFGFLMSCQGVGALIGALTVATLSESPRKGPLFIVASLTFPVLLIALSQVGRVHVLGPNHAYIAACVLVALTGYAMICFLATANGLVQSTTPDHLRGRIMGLYSLLLMGLTPLGSLWSGIIANRGGTPAAIAVGGVAIGLFALFVVVRYPAMRGMKHTLPASL